MTNPPRVFVGGSDALAMVTPAIEARLKDMHAYDALSRSTDIASRSVRDPSVAEPADRYKN
jgi:hypothetical protein